MSIDYKHQWSSIMGSAMLNLFSGALFDKQLSSSRFYFIWPNRFGSKTNVRRSKKTKKVGKTIKKKKVGTSFSWIDNAKKGTNATKCVKSYITSQNDHTTLLNFFFRENFSLKKLRKKSKRQRLSSVLKGLNSFLLKDKLLDIVKAKHPWLTRRRLRKLSRKNTTRFDVANLRAVSLAKFRYMRRFRGGKFRSFLSRLPLSRRYVTRKRLKRPFRFFYKKKPVRKLLQGVPSNPRRYKVAPKLSALYRFV